MRRDSDSSGGVDCSCASSSLSVDRSGTSACFSEGESRVQEGILYLGLIDCTQIQIIS